MSFSRIVIKPEALELARHAHSIDCLALNVGRDTYTWAAKRGWLTSDDDKSLFRKITSVFTKESWVKAFKNRAVENEENLKLAIYDSGADLMVPQALFTVENETYVIK